MKHLKIRGELTEDKKAVRFFVVEQTHLWGEFGNERGIHDKAIRGCLNTFRHKRIVLYSYSQISIHKYHPGRNDHDLWLLVIGRGHTVKDFEKSFLILTLAEWDEVKEAVIAYNEWGASQ